MNQSVCIFEDNKYSQLYPLSLTRPVFDLRCGMLTLKEKIIKLFPNRSISLFCRDYLKDVVQQQNPDTLINKIDSEMCLFINGRVIIDSDISKIFNKKKEEIYFYEGQVVGAFLKRSNMSKFVKLLKNNANLKELSNVPRKEIKDITIINYCWDLVHHNSSEIEKDFTCFNKGGVIKGKVSEHAVLINKRNIYIGKDAEIKAGAILDADKGSIYVSEGAKILHNAVLEGPSYIGERAMIKIAAKIYEGTSIGEFSKVGGEVEESIIHSFSNKQHDGFLGHAYLGQWVNIGADTNNSDLKNNYSNVKVYVNGKMVDSGSMFVGLILGDHSKTGINTMFNTGTVVGVMCNVFGSGFPPKYIPSFSWGGAEKIVEHDLDKALDTAHQVMARRKQELTPEYEKMLRHIFESIRPQIKS